MGIGDFFKKMFSSGPIEVDYSNKTDVQIREIWSKREGLTQAARDALDGELEERGLNFDEEAPKQRLVTSFEGPPIEREYEFDSMVLFAQQNAGVYLETREGNYVFIVMPIRNCGDALYEKQEPSPPEDAEVSHVVVMNERETGWLATQHFVEQLGVEPENVFVLDADRPASRAPDDVFEAGESWEGWLVIDGLGIEHVAKNVLRASWPQLGPTCLVGAPVDLDTLLDYPETQYVIGGIRVPVDADDWDEVGREVSAGLSDLQAVILMLDFEGASAFPWAALLPRVGINVQLEGPEAPVAAPAQPLLDAVLAGDFEAAREALGEVDATYVGPVVNVLIGDERLEDARRLVELEAEVVEARGEVELHRGVVEALEGNHEAALAAFEAAADGDRPEWIALRHAAAIHCWREDFDAAIDALERFDEGRRADEDEHSGDNMAMAIDAAGGVESHDVGDQSVEDPVVLTTVEGVEVLRDSDHVDAVAEARPMPLVAGKLAEFAAALNAGGRPNHARLIAERALRLSPFDVIAIGERARGAAAEEGTEDGMAILDEALADWPDNRYLNLIRAEFLHDLEHWDESTALYEKLAEDNEGWAPPRVQLVATYAEDDRLEEAEELLDQLDGLGVDEQVMFTLERMVDDARLRQGKHRNL